MRPIGLAARLQRRGPTCVARAHPRAGCPSLHIGCTFTFAFCLLTTCYLVRWFVLSSGSNVECHVIGLPRIHRLGAHLTLELEK